MLNGRDLLRVKQGTWEENHLKIIKALMCLAGNQENLALRCGVSQGTISNHVRSLREKGIVYGGANGKGTKTRLKQLTGVGAGVALEARRTTLLAKRLDGHAEHLLHHLDIGLESDLGWVEPVVESLRAMTAGLGPEAPDLLTLGIALPIMVNSQTNELGASSLPPWWPPGMNPVQLLQTRLDEIYGAESPHVIQDRNTTLGALAEQILGAEGKEIVVFVGVSRHVSIGIVIGDRIYRGANGAAGLIGHNTIRTGGAPCWCGNRGCLEAYLSIDMMLEQARRFTGTDLATLDELVATARAGDGTCRRVLREGGALLGEALGPVCNTLSPNLMLIGGDISAAGSFFLDPCEAALQQSAARPAWDGNLTLGWSRLSNAVAHGALLIGILGHHRTTNRH